MLSVVDVDLFGLILRDENMKNEKMKDENIGVEGNFGEKSCS